MDNDQVVNTVPDQAQGGTEGQPQPPAAPASMPLRVLALDGGGIRGYSEIIIVEQLMLRVKHELELPTLPKPCDYFDLICGTSTGGIIAILLGRLRMSVKEVKDVYKELCKEIFSNPKKHVSEGKFSATNLETLMKKTIANCEASNVSGRTTEAERAELPLIEAPDEQKCKVFVCTRAAQAVGGVTVRKFRTYDMGVVGQEEDLMVWQAGRATSAAPTFFKRMKIGLVDYLDGGIGFNNPAKTLLDEIHELYDDRPIACIISVGAGVATIKGNSAPKGWQKLIPKELIETFAAMVTDCETTAHDLEVKFRHMPQVYHRFSVQRGLESIGMEEWQKLGDVEARTVEYLQLDKNMNEVSAVAKALSVPVASGLKASDLILGYRQFQIEENIDIIRKWLIPTRDDSPPDVKSNYLEAKNKREPESTGQWFLRSLQYSNWKDSETASFQLLWLTGGQGRGKTVLCSSVIGDIDFPVAFFFFDFNDSTKQEPDLMVKSILSQLLYFEIQPQILESLASCIKRPPHKIEPLHALKQIIEGLQVAYVVLDALDECHQKKEQLMKILKHIADWKLKNLHVLVASKPDEEMRVWLREDFPTSAHYEIVDLDRDDENAHRDEEGSRPMCEIRRDIRQYIRSKFEKSVAGRIWDDRKQEIENNLVDGADGVFRWAACQLNLVDDCDDEDTLNDILRGTYSTTGLVEIYDRSLGKVTPLHKTAIKRLLTWVASAPIPLTLEEIAEAIAINPNIVDDRSQGFSRGAVSRRPARLINLCYNLVRLREESENTAWHWPAVDQSWDDPSAQNLYRRSVVVLDHSSVLQYLISDHIKNRTSIKEYALEEEQFLDFMTHCCVQYLEQPRLLEVAYSCWAKDEIRANSDLVSNFKFAPYAAEFISMLVRRGFSPSNIEAERGAIFVGNISRRLSDRLDSNFSVETTEDQGSDDDIDFSDCSIRM